MSVTEAESINGLRELAEQSGAWPFEEARKIVARLKKKPKDEVIFSTGYGPSGLPHIGTFGEVARTTMVRHAFRVLTDDKIRTRLLAFSDDMDGLRKVPDNVPNGEMLTQDLGKPLTRVRDPFGTHPSFGAHNNARLRAFLDTFGFDYEFLSATECYTSGRFDKALLQVLSHFDKVMAVMLPSLREERAQTYSPFLPISERTGIVLQVPVTAHDAAAGTITYEDPDTKESVTTPVTGGRCKLQWKPDWAMRWYALGVDYEMAGKDLIDSVKLSGEINRAIGGTPPEGFNYELFLDEKGQKISKSKGNGITIDEWLRYASPESLSLFMYREPKAAKRLYFDVIPRNVDEYFQFLDGYQRQDGKQRLGNPVWHIHAGHPPQPDMPINFQLLLTLVSSSNAENPETLWGFIGRYRPGVTPATHPKLDAMVGYAINYYRDFVLPTKKFRDPAEQERTALFDLRDALSNMPADSTPEKIQDVVYEIGRREPFLDEKKKAKDGKPGVSLEWFNMLYQVLLGQEKGPRFGSFVAAYGLKNTVDMIDGALARSKVEDETKVPDWLTGTVEDLIELDFEMPIAGSNSADPNVLGDLYGAAAKNTKHGAEIRVFGMLSAVLGMLFKPQDRNEPFGPMVVFADGRRSAVPKDFNGPPLKLLSAASERASHPVLRARLADVSWLLDRTKAQLADIAAASYVEVAKRIETGALRTRFDGSPVAFKREVRDLLRRALQIGRAIGWDREEMVATRDFVVQLRKSAVQQGQPRPALWFGDLDLTFSISDPEEVATDVESLIDRQSAAIDPDAVVDLWRFAARAYHLARNESAKYRCKLAAAEQLALMADGQSAMLASQMLSEAIGELHGVPSARDRRKILRHRLVDVQAGIADEMSVFSHPLDLSEIASAAEKAVDQLPLLDTLFLLAAVSNSPEPSHLVKEAQESIERHPLSSLFATTFHDREGKVVHRTDGGGLGESGADSSIRRQIAQNEGIRRQIVSQGQIEVMRRVIVQRHFLSEDTFAPLLLRSPFVPADLRATFSRGFLRFFQGDYVSALYTLTPLLENSLRYVLRNQGHDVTIFDDARQTQEDRTISSLFEQMRKEMESIFGEAIIFDIENVFLSRPGPSIRHQIAHGLLHDGDPYGHDAIYACWTIFRLCMLPLFPHRAELRDKLH